MPVLVRTAEATTRNTAHPLMSQSPLRQTMSKKPGKEAASSASFCQNAEGGVVDLTTPRRPTTHKTRSRRSVGRRERGVFLAVVNNLTLDGGDHSGTPVALWLITGWSQGGGVILKRGDLRARRLAMVAARLRSISRVVHSIFVRPDELLVP